MRRRHACFKILRVRCRQELIVAGLYGRSSCRLRCIVLTKSSRCAARRSEASYAIERYGVSERRGCRLMRLQRATWQCRSRRPADSALRELAGQLPRFGYKRLYRRLRSQGTIVNHKKVYRIYREEGLMVRKGRRKRLVRRDQVPGRPTSPNERWSMDFPSDQLSNGRRFRTCNVVDDCTREA